MRKLAMLVGALALAGSSFAFAQGIGGFGGPMPASGPQGFANQAPNTVESVLRNGFDDQYVTLTGRLTRYLGHDRYEFTDNTGRIEVELDDDRNWSHIQKDQLITIYGEIDKDFLSINIDVMDARPVANGPQGLAPQGPATRVAPAPAQAPAPAPTKTTSA